jgi:hypothetical protein
MIYCTHCFPGYYTTAGLSACTKCSAGTQTPDSGYSSCEDCEAGKSSSSGRRCSTCQAGTYSAPQASNGTWCVLGSTSGSESEECVPCDFGKSTEGAESNQCAYCRPRLFHCYGKQLNVEQMSVRQLSDSVRSKTPAPVDAHSPPLHPTVVGVHRTRQLPPRRVYVKPTLVGGD